MARVNTRAVQITFEMSKEKNSVPSYAIIGFGNIGKALAKAFARNGIEVRIRPYTGVEESCFWQAMMMKH